MGNKKSKRICVNCEKIIYVRYQDHHWIEDGSTLEDILEQDILGANSVVLEEVGFLLVNHRDYYIISAYRQIDSTKAEDEISYSKSIRILKRDVLTTKIFDVPRPK